MILRKDNWNHEEDRVLADTVLRFAKEGKSLKEALNHLDKFDMIPGRTKTAITLRWYQYIRGRVLRQQEQSQPALKLVAPLLVQEEPTKSTSSVTLEQCMAILQLPHDNLTAEVISAVNNRILELMK